MSTGLQIFGPAGQLWMDSDTITWNLVEVYTLGAGVYDQRTYTELAGREFLVLQIPLEVPKVEDYTYEKSISVSGNVVTVSGGNQIASIVVMCR